MEIIDEWVKIHQNSISLIVEIKSIIFFIIFAFVENKWVKEEE